MDTQKNYLSNGTLRVLSNKAIFSFKFRGNVSHLQLEVQKASGFFQYTLANHLLKFV